MKLLLTFLSFSVACDRSHPPMPPKAATVAVPAGSVLLGCNRWPTNYVAGSISVCAALEWPTRVPVVAFDADLHLVDHKAFEACVDAGVCHFPVRKNWAPTATRTATQGVGELPIASTWLEAASYCRWQGKELPSVAQWERLTRGDTEQMYPWGDSPPTCDRGPSFFDRETQGEPTFCALKPPAEYANGTPFGADGLFGWNGEWTRDLPAELSEFSQDDLLVRVKRLADYATFDWVGMRVSHPPGTRYMEGIEHVIKGTWLMPTNGGEMTGSETQSIAMFRCVSRSPKQGSGI